MLAGLPSLWHAQYSLPDDLRSKAQFYLQSLSDTMGLKGQGAAADLLQGQTVALLLKDFGAKLGGKSAVDSLAGVGLDAERLQCLRALTVLLPLLDKHIGNHALQVSCRGDMWHGHTHAAC